VQRISLAYPCGLFTLDSKPIKQDLLPIATEYQEQVQEQLHRVFRETAKDTFEKYTALIAQLKEIPHSLSEFCAFCSFLTTVPDTRHTLTQQTEYLEQLKIVAAKQNTSVIGEDLQLFLSVLQARQDFQLTFIKATELRDSQHAKNVAQLIREAQKLEQDTGTTYADLNHGILMDDGTECEAALTRLATIDAVVTQLKERKATLENYVEILGAEPILFPHVNRCVARYTHRFSLWSTLNKFQSSMLRWKTTPLVEFDPADSSSLFAESQLVVQGAEKAETETAVLGPSSLPVVVAAPQSAASPLDSNPSLDEISRLVSSLDPEVNPVVHRLSVFVSGFAPFVPILTAICTPAMQQRHWAQLFDAMGRDWEATAPVSTMLNNSVLPFRVQCYEVSAIARNEQQVQARFDEV
jgi:hypothetical protein